MGVHNQRRQWLLINLNRIPIKEINRENLIENQFILKYGSGKFQIATENYEGSVIVFPTRTYIWPVSNVKDISMDNLAPVSAQNPPVEILLIGCGNKFSSPLKGLREDLSNCGIVLEWMDTGAASRTYNVLMAEGRRCAAALIAVD